MNLPDVVTEAEWEAAREELVAEEKAATRARDTPEGRTRLTPPYEWWNLHDEYDHVNEGAAS